ncbi:hypothetical protein A1Q1_01040 [Trichosporon asahii var. asahii CBS 2479]|uniref:Major facilitator superfamily (MFS) profile domain-containing protein n=1 Tax=Trichosporon asahii var. asahii (strain ATCC 90039 / CBS 2479 / JCM 2466 / KCTC 7840 / NBRC 103889/ NCYC 2677 / UAMH 7654) TaxID=1186058 RepID=J6EYR8_TRIAS|nr:hypothetical protein A1Q1_01040 [Trichosporon asahii var. asahii CBS 2479]EJT49814.1 hypothetical protein A1Q1_01040 [Trichosporon asahii var. asahii CBS 2479]
MPTHVEEVQPVVAGKGRDPTLPPNHPINAFSPMRKMGIVLSLAYAGCLANFAIAICNVSFGWVTDRVLADNSEVGKSLGVGPGDIANALGYNLLGCGVGSLFWNPLSRSWGRRPVYLIGSFLFMPVCVWEALSKNYACFVVARIMAGIVTSWSQTIPPSSIAEIYVPQMRGSKMSIFGVAVVIGPVIVPIFAAAIVEHHSWRNLFWFNLGLAALQFLLILFFVPETMWNWEENTDIVEVDDKKDTVVEHKRSGYVGPAFLPHTDWKRFWPLCWSPIYMIHYIVITVPSFYYGICLGFLSVAPTVIFPQIFGKPPYSFAVVPLGCAFLGFGVGGVLGKWSGGHVSDMIVAYMERKHGRRIPEDRLWAGIPLLPLMFIGQLLCGVCVQYELHWMCFIVGAAINFFALSGITTVILTYVLETYISKGMDTQAVFNFWKYLWGFAVPFFTMKWGETRGWMACFCGMGAVLTGFGALMIAGLIWKGHAIRKWQNMPMED